MPKPRVLLVPMLVAALACVLPAARSFAAAGCTPGGTPAPPGAGMRQIGDLDGDGGPDTLSVAQFRGGNGRSARLYTFTECGLQTVVDSQGAPFVFDRQNLRDHGTGVGCSDLGTPSSGRHLVGLQALENNSQWTVRCTEIDLNGTLATIGQSDTVTASSAQDPVVTSAETISCGELIIGKDGVQQP